MRTYDVLVKALFVLMLHVVVSVSPAATQPARFSYQARLTDNAGLPLVGVHTLYLKIFEGGTIAAADSGVLRYAEERSVTLTDGLVNVPVGTGPIKPLGPLDATIFHTGSPMFLQVAVDAPAQIVLPRNRLEPVPFAIASADGERRTPIGGTGPIVISTPGSYYLDQNVTGVVGQSGITITTGLVNLDLNGFAVLGVPGSRHGIEGTPGTNAISIRGGTIADWDGFGVMCTTTSQAMESCRFEYLTLRDNHGGLTSGVGGEIFSCTARDNNGPGFAVGAGCQVKNCVATFNSGGYVMGSGCLIIGCIAEANGDAGITATTRANIQQCSIFNSNSDAIRVTDACLISNCMIAGIVRDGIEFGSDCLVTGNICDGAGSGVDDGAAIKANGSGNRIDGNAVTDTDFGIQCLAADNLVIRNSASGNSQDYSMLAGNHVAAIVSNPGANFTNTNTWANFSF